MSRPVPGSGSGLRLALSLVLAGWTIGASPASAQRVDVELTGGAAVGNYTAAGAGLDILPEPAFGVRVDVWPTATLAGYLGFTRSSFGCEEGFCTGRDVSFTSQGLVLGGRWSPGLPWARAGLAMHRLGIAAPGGGGDQVDPGVGVELAAGVDFGLGDRVRVRPGVRYLRHGATSELGAGHVALLALELGVAAQVAWF